MTKSELLEDIAWQLGRLENAYLIRLAAAQPELEYIFRHALVQECAYQSLVRADRRRVHRAAGLALEALSGGATPPLELSLQLARHFEEADDDSRAIHYYVLAGDAALKLFANIEAVAAYTRALACAARSSTTVETWEHLYSGRGRALELNSQYDAALANYQSMARTAESLGHRRLALSAAVAVGQLYATTTPLFDLPRAEQMSAAALAEARALGDEAAEAKILWNQLNLYRFTQRNPQARVVGEQSLAIAQRLGLREQAALDLNDLIHVYVALGLWSQGYQAADEAGRLWRELGNTAMLADSLSTFALYASLRGDFVGALAHAQEAQRLSLSIGNLWGQSYSFSGMTLSYWYTGHPGRALEVTQACIRLGRQGGYMFAEILDQGRLGYMLGELGDAEQGLSALRVAEVATKMVGGAGLSYILADRIHMLLLADKTEQAVETLNQMETIGSTLIWEADAVLRAHAEVALARGDGQRALEVTQELIARLHLLGLLVYLPEALMYQGQALELAGRPTEALELLHEARERVQNLDAPVIEWRVLHALGGMEARHGRAVDAQAAWARARALVLDFAARVPTPALRASFLARRDVRVLLGEAASVAAQNLPPASAPRQP